MMALALRPLLVALMMVLLTGGALAQRSESEDDQDQDQMLIDQIQSDRPVIIRAPDVENHQHQIEVDVVVSRDRDGTPAKVRMPVLYRLDTGPDTELRVQSDFLTYQNPNLGFSDVSLGFKWNFIDGVESSSLIAILELPTGSAGFADPGPEPTILLAHNRPLGGKWNFGLNAGLSINRDVATLDYYGQINAAAQFGYNISPDTELSAAVLVKTPDAHIGGINRLSGALSVSHAVNLHNRLNLSVGRSFSSTGDDYLVLFGWSRRI